MFSSTVHVNILTKTDLIYSSFYFFTVVLLMWRYPIQPETCVTQQYVSVTPTIRSSNKINDVIADCNIDGHKISAIFYAHKSRLYSLFSKFLFALLCVYRCYGYMENALENLKSWAYIYLSILLTNKECSFYTASYCHLGAENSHTLSQVAVDTSWPFFFFYFPENLCSCPHCFGLERISAHFEWSRQSLMPTKQDLFQVPEGYLSIIGLDQTCLSPLEYNAFIRRMDYPRTITSISAVPSLSRSLKLKGRYSAIKPRGRNSFHWTPTALRYYICLARSSPPTPRWRLWKFVFTL